MKKIDKLILKNFKFFYGEEVLNFDNENILFYGENGSGKSSIYWALYTLLQSSTKKTDEEKHRILKYFDKSDGDTLVNRYMEDSDTASISITLNNGSEYIVSLDDTNTNLEDIVIYEAYTVSDFINYKLLAKNFDFKHSENLDIFEFLEKNIFDDIFTEDKTTTFGKWWKKISSVYTLKGQANKYNNTKELEVDINLFFEALKNYLSSITEDMNTILRDYFKLNINIKFEPELDITLLNKYRRVFRLDGQEKQQTTYYAKFPWIYLHVEYDEYVHEENDKYINRPHTYLNEAKLSAIALSVRFAMLRKKANTNDILKILVLDDLLVSLDMNNRSIVLNMLINDEYLNDYQIIMLTHDKAFFEMAKQKFQQSSEHIWKYYEMYVDDSGEVEKPFIKKSKSYLDRAYEEFLNRNYDCSANLSRKACEGLLFKYLPSDKKFSLICDKLQFNNLLQNARSQEQNTSNAELFNKLDTFRMSIFNPQSHSDDTEVYREELKDAINTVKTLKEFVEGASNAT
ncbi:MAG: ATP-binding protein [Campylobacterota bacterium]|nr:ATP-binding protein [Campylobacterota bacterium]